MCWVFEDDEFFVFKRERSNKNKRVRTKMQRSVKNRRRQTSIAKRKRTKVNEKEGFGGDAKWLSFRIGCAVPFVSSRLLPCVSERDWCASGSR